MNAEILSLEEQILASELTEAEKVSLLSKIHRIRKALSLAELKYERTHKERTALTVLTAEISKDLNRKMEEIEEKSRALKEALGTVRVTSRKLEDNNRKLIKAQEIAQEANLAKSRFLANMSHEIRTPLTGIMGMAQLLEQTGLNTEQNSYLSTILDSSQALLQLINDILDLSKIEAGRLSLVESEFYLSRSIENCTHLFMPQFREKGLSLSVNISDDVPDLLVGDAFRLNQIFNNLIGNALKFTIKGQITLRIDLLENDKTGIRIGCEIKDTGIGIPVEIRSVLFDAFTQADDSNVRKFQGSGLGLSITKSLVEKMGGSIDVESQVGKGSTFRFDLRFGIPQAGSLHRQLPEKRREKFSFDMDSGLHVPGKVLLVEDNPVNQTLTMTVLRKMGIECDLAENGLEAVEKCESLPYWLILMDLQMPELDGFEATARLREKEKEIQQNKPVIVAMTANVSEEVRSTCLECGMDDFIGKPFKLKDLKQIIEKWGAQYEYQ